MRYESDVKLGQEHTDRLHGITGVAINISFFQHGCARVELEWFDAPSSVHQMVFDELRLTPTSVAGKESYESDLRLGERYREEQTGIEGILDVVTFHLHGCERGQLQWVERGEVKEMQFDAPRLIHIETKKKAKTTTTGGPTRGSSHVRPGPSRR